MNDVTRILEAIAGGDPSAAARLLPLVYDELRVLAAARTAEPEKSCVSIERLLFSRDCQPCDLLGSQNGIVGQASLHSPTDNLDGFAQLYERQHLDWF